MNNRKGLLALSPLFVFVTIYLVASIIAQDFYKVPISVAFVIASIYAVAISYKDGLRQSIDTFSKGASKEQHYAYAVDIHTGRSLRPVGESYGGG